MRLVDWMMAPEFAEGSERQRRARLLVTSSLALFVFGLLCLTIAPWAGGPIIWGIPVPPPVTSGLLAVLPVTLSIAHLGSDPRTSDRGALFLPAAVLVLVGYLAYFTGGFVSPIVQLLAAVPLLTAILAGPRFAASAGGITVALTAVFWLLDLQHHPFPDRPVRGPATVVELGTLVFMVSFVGFFSWVYESGRRLQTRFLIETQARLEETNRAVEINEQKFRQIAGNIGQAIWMTDSGAAGVVYVNDGYERLWGKEPSTLEANREAWKRLVHPEDAVNLPSDTTSDAVYRIVVGRKVRWIRHAVYPVAEDEGESHRHIHIAADVSAERKAAKLRARYLERVVEVQETERKHLARELHDETSQSLAALLVGLKAVEGTLTDPAVLEHVSGLRQQLRAVVTDLGRLARGLHPAILDELGLVTAVGRLADDVRDGHGINVQFRVSGFKEDADLPSNVKLTIYRITQESLSNVARHSGATQADVSLLRSPGGIHLRIEDDGKGFDPETTAGPDFEGGLGLLSMRERALLLRGTVTIESAAGTGTTVIADIPVRHPDMITAEVQTVW